MTLIRTRGDSGGPVEEIIAKRIDELEPLGHLTDAWHDSSSVSGKGAR